jgi:hypothetical protein
MLDRGTEAEEETEGRASGERQLWERWREGERGEHEQEHSQEHEHEHEHK